MSIAGTIQEVEDWPGEREEVERRLEQEEEEERMIGENIGMKATCLFSVGGTTSEREGERAFLHLMHVGIKAKELCVPSTYVEEGAGGGRDRK